ncbi:unnamed protein product [Amoebophrya sp. A120]|nr:unnamed protein product [Amoebophrya sp. A120]CAD7947651.1 unnamed protein product [Amoebophrya sp. A120]|eukprot:GSA120T00017028001.1
MRGQRSTWKTSKRMPAVPLARMSARCSKGMARGEDDFLHLLSSIGIFLFSENAHTCICLVTFGYAFLSTTLQLSPLSTSRNKKLRGVDNDVRVFDVRERKLVWKAKNLPNDKLDLQVPIRYSRIHWATEALDCDTALVCCTMDGKIRIFDMKAKQPRALFDLPVVYKRERSIGHAGAAGKEERPITASVLTDNGILAVGDTVGNLDIFDLTKTKPYLTGTPDSLLFQNKMVKDIPKIASIAHHEYVWKGQIIKYLGACAPEGSAIRSLCFIPQTKQLASVGLGRFATVHKALESDKRREQDKKTYMKQKLTAVVALPPVDLSKVKVEGEEAETQKTDNSKARSTPASSSKNTTATTVADADELASDAEEEEEEEGMLSDDDIVSELSYGSYVQEFDDDDESSEEVAPPPKKKRNKGRK